MAPPNCNPVQENDGHRILQNREGEGAEKHHGHQQHPADHAAMVQKACQFTNHRLGLSRNQPFKISSQRGEQLALVDDLRQRDHHENKQRHDRQQRVVRDGTGQQQPLIRTKGAQDAQGESPWVRHHVRGLSSESSHSVGNRWAKRRTAGGRKNGQEKKYNPGNNTSFLTLQRSLSITFRWPVLMRGRATPARIARRVRPLNRNRLETVLRCRPTATLALACTPLAARAGPSSLLACPSRCARCLCAIPDKRAALRSRLSVWQPTPATLTAPTSRGRIVSPTSVVPRPT